MKSLKVTCWRLDKNIKKRKPFILRRFKVDSCSDDFQKNLVGNQCNYKETILLKELPAISPDKLSGENDRRFFT